MNQKMLIVAVVAVVAIVIVIGVWVTGAGQSGPLAGDIAVTPSVSSTTLTLNVTVQQNEGARILEFSGILTNSSGTGVPGKTVTVNTNPNPSSVVGTAMTGSDGAFSVTYTETIPTTYYAAFAGDSLYKASRSDIVAS
jgi:hypothetical protein